ncbi:MAG: hypothetical protein AAGI25_02855, partial [Bacteroidota bacterium]
GAFAHQMHVRPTEKRGTSRPLRALQNKIVTLRPPQLSLAIVGMLTFFTNEPIGPFELSKVVIASLVIRKLLLELEEGKALVFFLHNFVR